MSITINVLIATIGKPILQRMINSLADQLTENDYLTIVFDGHKSIPKFDLSKIKAKVIQYFEPIALGYWGHGIRNKYAELLETTDFVMHADDDNIYLANAFKFIRENCTNKELLHVCRTRFNISDITPKDKNIGYGNIDTSCGIIPYELNKKGTWAYVYGGDGLFYESLLKHNSNFKYFDHIIYEIRPGEIYTRVLNSRNKFVRLGLVGRR